jgi:hypothetical protein
MRTFVLIGIAMVLLLGGFYYFALSDRPDMYVETPQTQPTTRRTGPASSPAVQEQGLVGQSGGVWVETRDRKTYRLASRFRADQFDPRRDNSVDVARPQAQFYGTNGVVTLDGSSGRVSMSQPGSREDTRAMGESTPTEGELKDVVIRFYESYSENGEPTGEPTIITTVPAIRFDAIANRIATIDSIVDGKGVMAEQVPVTVRGRDFEFDGQGLTMRWNDREGRLDNLEINKGDRLLVKNLERFGGNRLAQVPLETTPPSTIRTLSPRAILASAIVGQVETSTRPARASNNLYHATFDRDVHIVRGGKELGAADVMRVVIPLGSDRAEEKEKPQTPSDRKSKRNRQAASQPDTRPETKPQTHSATKPAAKSMTKAAPATQPEEPLEIRWTGKLTIRPAALVENAPREQMAELVGAPAWVEEAGGRVEARLIHVEPESGRVRIEPGGPVRAISVKDAQGTEIRSNSPLVIDRTTGIAEISGGGILNAAAQGERQATRVAWSKRLQLLLSTDGTQSLKSVRVEGDAKVESETLNLNCQTLTLGFDAPEGASARAESENDYALPAPDLALLRSIDADGSAKLTMGEGESVRYLSGNMIHLDLTATAAADGSTTPSVTGVKCDGDVLLVDGQRLNLSCQNLDVKTRPIGLDPATTMTNQGDAADPLGSILSMVATGNVGLAQADGSRAVGDRLEFVAATEQSARQFLLIGKPALLASAKGSLEGDRIELDPQTGNVNVPGPGKFVGTDPDRPQNVMSIAWADSMAADGDTGVCRLNGGVVIAGTDGVGSRLNATARRCELAFVLRQAGDGPTTAPVSPATSGVTLDAVRSLDLSDDVDVQLMSRDQRSSSLQTQAVRIDLEAGVVTAPQAGRMLLIDERAPATTRPATTRAKDDVGPGTLALAWRDNLVWKLREGALTINGGVRVGFERPGLDDTIRITCETIVCELTPVQTGKGFEQVAQRVELRSITARDRVAVRSRNASFDAASLAYDALTGRATAVGDADTKVDVYDADGTSHVGFSAITWNVETGIIEDFRDIDGRIRR